MFARLAAVLVLVASPAVAKADGIVVTIAKSDGTTISTSYRYTTTVIPPPPLQRYMTIAVNRSGRTVKTISVYSGNHLISSSRSISHASAGHGSKSKGW